MNWNEHSKIEGEHAFLGASNYHWLNYTPEKLVSVYRNSQARLEGTKLHDFASMAISRKIKLSKTKNTLNQFVNDSIGFNMDSERMLFYSFNSFGTADAISFKKNVLRIFDFKTGVMKTSFKQLDIYAALFCLEYTINPKAIVIEQRIYQSNTYREEHPDGDYISEVMNRIVHFDEIIEQQKLTP